MSPIPSRLWPRRPRSEAPAHRSSARSSLAPARLAANSIGPRRVRDQALGHDRLGDAPLLSGVPGRRPVATAALIVGDKPGGIFGQVLQIDVATGKAATQISREEHVGLVAR